MYTVTLSGVVDAKDPRDAVLKARDAVVERTQIIEVEVRVPDVVGSWPYSIDPVESTRTTTHAVPNRVR